jgi:hypothetical protein
MSRVIAGRYCRALLRGKCRLITPIIAKKSSDEQFLKASRNWEMCSAFVWLSGFAGHYLGTLLRDVIALLRVVIVEHNSRVIGGRYCEALLRDIIVGHY